jgi:hypothetical protein
VGGGWLVVWYGFGWIQEGAENAQKTFSTSVSVSVWWTCLKCLRTYFLRMSLMSADILDMILGNGNLFEIISAVIGFECLEAVERHTDCVDYAAGVEGQGGVCLRECDMVSGQGEGG